MNTHNAFVRFGKYNGQRLTHVPVGYLRWAVASRCTGTVELADKGVVPMYEAAQYEIGRRGEHMTNIEVSRHAIDRASLYFIPRFRFVRGHMEGFVSWLQRLAWEAWQQRASLGRRQDDGTWRIEYSGIVFVVDELAVPVVKTVETMATEPLFAIAETLLSCLVRGKSRDCPTIDFAVEGVRSSLREGLPRFKELAWKTFENRLTPGRARIYYRIFMREIERPLASLVLSGQMEP